jgi:Flp pilus assembly pilin Flp
MLDLLKTLWRDDSGQDTTEHVLLVLLVALAVTAGMSLFGTEINEAFSASHRPQRQPRRAYLYPFP